MDWAPVKGLEGREGVFVAEFRDRPPMSKPSRTRMTSRIGLRTGCRRGRKITRKAEPESDREKSHGGPLRTQFMAKALRLYACCALCAAARRISSRVTEGASSEPRGCVAPPYGAVSGRAARFSPV